MHSAEFLGLAIALAGTTWAARVDLKTMRIPNQITYPLIAIGIGLGILRVIMGETWWWLALLGLLAYLFTYFAWIICAWGGGDAKLVLAIALLVPTLWGEPFLPILLTSIALCLLACLFITSIVRRPRALPLLLAPLAGGAGVYAVAGPVYGALAFALTADVLSPFVLHAGNVNIRQARDEDLVGRVPAEEVWEDGGRVMCKRRSPSLIISLLRGESLRTLLTEEDIGQLREICDEILLEDVHPMGPAILGGLILAVVIMWLTLFP